LLPCCQHQKWNDHGPQAHREKKITSHFFTLMVWFIFLNINLRPTTPWLLTQPPAWIWRRCCYGPAVNNQNE
jgi:hypothetical protein